jgi:hypothetical protein
VLRAASDFILERDARREGKHIVGDKSPSSLLDGESVRLMHAVYPDARLVYILRDGRDTVLSHRFQAWIDSPQHLTKEDLRIRDDFTNAPAAFGIKMRSLFTEKGIRHAAEGWVRNVTETDQLGRQLFPDRYLLIKYEELLKAPWEQMTHLWQFLGAAHNEQIGVTPEQLAAEMQSNPDAGWQQEKSAAIERPGLAQALKKGQAGNWRELFTQRDRQIFHQVAGETLALWGYESTIE